MHLKSLTMKGFKSFPDRTTLEFGTGTSVIVGPNGSGKSNVTDAVLWALGEQSPAAIRGQSMQDVIFGGGPGRQAAQSASVELVLSDAEGTLGLGPEVSIYRHLERGGEGEYRLAGARCRLIDVLELLSDTGLGKEMHSVVSQGRVESIVTSRPRDRRLLIEEAAGLGKHRKRRRRAQLKLGHTQDNLDRALDVEREARSRLRPLKRQAEAAELHQRLHRQTLEARWQLGRDDLRSRQVELETALAAAAAARAAREQVERELEAVSARRREAEEELTARSSRREQLSRQSFGAQSAVDRIAYRADGVRAAAELLAARAARSGERLAQLTEAGATDAPDPEAAARIAVLRDELEALERDREAELERQLAELEALEATAIELEQERAEAVEQAAATRAAASGRCEQGRDAVREAERALDGARRERARVGGELAAVNQFLRGHQRALGGSSSLADGLNVAAGFELAVAAALDGRLGAALLEDRGAAGKLLDRAGPEGGRVLLATGAGGGAAGATAGRRGTRAPLAGAKRLADCVSGEGEAAALVQALLRDVWVVEEIAAVPDDFDGVAVTTAGRVFSPAAHELRQAASLGEERVLAERNRREQLIAASEAAVQQEHSLQAALDAAIAEAARLDHEHDAALAAHRAALLARDEAAAEQQRLAAAIARRREAPDDGPGAGRRAQLEAELAAEQARAERLERERAERLEQIERLRGLGAREQALRPQLESILAALEELVEVVLTRRAEFDSALAADREADVDAAEQLRTCAQQEAALQNLLNAAGDGLTGAEVQAQRARDRTDEAGATVSALAAELELEAEPAGQPLTEDERAELATRLERLARRREQLGPVNPLARDEYDEALAHVEELERQRVDLETAIRELQVLIRDTDKQIREAFDQTFAAAARNFEELIAELLPNGSGRLRLVSESEPQARVLGGQRLERDAAGTADAGAEAGDAPDEPELEADAAGEDAEELLGVEIEITSGRATKQLSLLSGGEKSMTALAFLFAVFLARPCPFYILDEVEAALDDLNISRFLDLLDNHSDRAQFIVVTHQKRTMEAADTLYGVSMGADGISKVISRRLPAREAA